ncbi:MAG: hypothetical protein JSR67_14830 [Proteobacteria bacterium]|nr:hypothetical protein [Pseudomonadota bacterium]
MSADRFRSAALLLALAALAASAREPPPVVAHAWPNTLVGRLEASLLVQTLNTELLGHDSATVTLEQWCARHQIATPARIMVRKVSGAQRPASEQQRRELEVVAGEPLRYRRVQLLCGDVVLSEADNWYVPARLDAPMNRALDTTDVPFGRVVAALHFRRHVLSSRLLEPLLPQDWELHPESLPADAPGALPLPAHVLELRAVLTLPDGTPFSEVVESYTAAVLSWP